MRTLNLDEAAALLKISPRSLADRRYRAKLPLAARKIGRKIVFVESDIDKLIACSREHLPRARRRWTNFLLARCYAFVYVSLRVALTPDRSTLRFLLRLIASALC